jgi:acetyl esterase/lipase
MYPSLIYRAEMLLVRLFGHKRIFSLPEPELQDWMAKYQLRLRTGAPFYMRFDLHASDWYVGDCACAVLEPRTGWEPGSPVVLLLHGGGFIFEALFAHWLAARRIVRQTGARVFLLHYPLLPEASAYEAHDVVAATWQQLQRQYWHTPEQITVLGDSAGAMLALTLAYSLRDAGDALPRQLILVSPPQSRAPDAATWQRMQACAERDVMIPLSLLDTVWSMMPPRPGRPEYFIRPLEQDPTGLPPTTIFTASDEVFSPLAEHFADLLEQAGVRHRLIRGEQMCHDWPYVPLAPESRQALKQIIRLVGKTS